MRTKKWALGLVIPLAVLGLASCSSDDGGDDAPTQTSSDLAASDAEFNETPYEDIAQGGTFTTALAEITPQFNTFHGDGTLYTSDVWRWYNPQIMLFAPDGTATVDPDYITAYDKTEVDGNTVVTYTINDEATYNDGTPIDWTSFQNTWTANNGENEDYSPSSTDGYSQIASVEMGDSEKQAVVTFDGIYAWVDGLFNFLLNPAVNTPELFNKAYLNEPHPEWGAGPYTLDTYDKQNGTISFVPNPNWWGDPGKLDSRVFRALESTASINAFKSGEIDATSVASQDRLTQVEGMSDIDIRRGAAPSQSLLTLNAGHEILSDLDVRKAVFMGIDRGVLADIEFQGLDYSEEPPGSFTLYPFQTGYEDNLTAAGYAFDPEAAGELLDGAGWTLADGAEFRTNAAGDTLTLSYAVIGDDPTTQAGVQATQAMLKTIGIEVTIDQHPSSDFSDVFLGGQFDLFALGFSSSDPFGFAYFCQIWCSDSGLNVSQTGNEEIDAKIDELTKIGDPDAQIEAGNALEQEIMAETYGIMPTTNGPVIIAVKSTVANFGADLFGVQRIQDIGFTE